MSCPMRYVKGLDRWECGNDCPWFDTDRNMCDISVAARSLRRIADALAKPHKNSMTIGDLPDEPESNLVGMRGLATRFKRLGISISWLDAEIKAGRIPYLSISKNRKVFDAEAVECSLLKRAREGSKSVEVQDGE